MMKKDRDGQTNNETLDANPITSKAIIMNPPPTCPLVHLATCGMIPFIVHDYTSNGGIMNHDFIHALSLTLIFPFIQHTPPSK